jgi:hypothetical protein
MSILLQGYCTQEEKQAWENDWLETLGIKYGGP